MKCVLKKIKGDFIVKKKIVLFVALALLCVALLGACGGGGDPEADIIGRWECHDDSQPHDWFCVLIFDANGRFTDRDGDEGLFSIDGSSLTLEFDDFEPFTFSFRLRGDRLTLTGDGGRVVLDRQ